uniref:Esterase FE4 n=1 Tax=Lygus hesperus TaxID=30085 RepID=A0A146M4H0_LYGHE
MKMTVILVKLLVLSLLAFAANCEIVVTPSGSVSGFEGVSRDGRTYLAWTKIPYGKPPVGPLRLAAPEPIEKWDGVLNATEDAPRCYQKVDMMPKKWVGQEDCLYLNVYKPKIDTKPLPVLVYVHGGAFFVGHPGPRKSPEYIMDEDVILVTIAYRLGALGFLSFNDKILPGNFGLKDQALGIKWIKENIAAFGGDPESITTFGESAGGASSHSLLLSPLTKDIVARSVAISGIVTKLWSFRRPESIVAQSRSLAERIGCIQADSAEVLSCLRGIDDPSKFSNYGDLNQLEPAIPVGPIIEPEGPGAFAPYELTETISTKPLMITYSAGEYLLTEIPATEMAMSKVKEIADNIDAYCQGYLKPSVTAEQLPIAAAKLKEKYMTHKDPKEVIHDVSMSVQDSAFVYPAMTAAEYHKGPKWVYHLEHRGELSLFDAMWKNWNLTVPSHADDLFSLFNVREYFKGTKPEANAEDTRVSKELIKYLANFAKYGNPTPEGSGFDWKPYKGNEILQIKTGGSVMADSSFVEEQKNVRATWCDILGTTKWF